MKCRITIFKIFKDKLSIFFNYLRSFFIVVAIFVFLSLLTFDINDNSFLTSSSEQTKNLLVSLALTCQVLFYILLGC